MCDNKPCHAELVDNLVHFGDALNAEDEANTMSELATISIAIGTKLMVTPAADWVFYPHLKKGKNRRGKVIIVNPQVTPADDGADLVIHHKADVFFQALCKALKIDVEQCYELNFDKIQLFFLIEQKKVLVVVRTQVEFQAVDYLKDLKSRCCWWLFIFDLSFEIS